MTADSRLSAVIEYGFYALVFLTPLLFTATTYELFEFPKMILVYALTVIIAAAFAAKAIIAGKMPRARTPLDRPIAAFLLVNILATVFSIDKYTSLWGYYTRFTGGLVSTVCYVALYYVFVGEIGKKREIRERLIGLITLSAFFVSVYGILQHFGIDKDFWVQDVQRRVFSTLGQPNWLAAYLVMVIPVGLTYKLKVPTSVFLSVVLYAAFWFTYSRSGLLGFAAMVLIFLTLLGWKNFRRNFAVFFWVVVFWAAISALTFTPTISGKIGETRSVLGEATPSAAAEAGGDDSGSTVKIRLAVWQGTLNLIAAHPFLGTGPETFAYSFLPYRPKELNQTAEWDFLYNKAHNEYLNIAATTGLLGLAAYLWLIVGFIRHRFSVRFSPLQVGLFAGWAGNLASNFFGFSVVATSLFFWVFMALIVSQGLYEQEKQVSQN